MRVALGAVRLSDITDGVLASGTVPLTRFQRTELSAENAGAVLNLAATGTTVVSLDLGTVTSGDRIFLDASLQIDLPAAGAHVISAEIAKDSGTATIAFANDLASFREDQRRAAEGDSVRFTLGAVVKATGNGTLVMKLAGYDSAATGDVAAGNGQIHAWVVPGS